MSTTDYTDPATIDVDEVIANINHDHHVRGNTWTDRLSWPNVTVKALADEVVRLRAESERRPRRRRRLPWEGGSSVNRSPSGGPEETWPWRGPYIAGMSACGICGAMVVYDGRQLHEAWHARTDGSGVSDEHA